MDAGTGKAHHAIRRRHLWGPGIESGEYTPSTNTVVGVARRGTRHGGEVMPRCVAMPQLHGEDAVRLRAEK